MDAVNHEKLKTRAVTLEELSSNIQKYNIGNYKISPYVVIGNVEWFFTSDRYPITTGNTFLMGKSDFLALDETYYNNHRELVDQVIASLVSNYSGSSISFADEFINDNLIDAIAKNKNVKSVMLGKNYSLKKEDYEKLKDTQIETIYTKDVSEELKDNFDEKIYANKNRQLITHYTYSQLKEANRIIITESVPVENFKYFEFLNEGTKISFTDLNDFENIFKIINETNKLGKNIDYCINVNGYSSKAHNDFDYKNELVKYVISNPSLLDLQNIIVGISYEDYEFKEFIKYEKRLLDLVTPAMNLSPLEKYLYAYNVAKKFKPYKENSEDLFSSRSLYQILDNDYMVCVGFSKLLTDLLKKLGIDCKSVSVGVDISMDDLDDDITVIPDTVISNKGGHARVMVNIDDPKYDVNGIYYADPTWDNCMDKDTYNFCLMTEQEYDLTYRANYFNVYETDELLTANSLEEFYFKINYYFKYKESVKKKDSEETYLSKVSSFKNEFVKFMEILKKVDARNYEWYSSIYSNLYNVNNYLPNGDRFMTRIQNVVKENHNKELTDAYNNLNDKYSSVKFFDKNKNRYLDDVKRSLLDDLLGYIAGIDPVRYQELKAKYGKYKDFNFEFDDRFISEFIDEVGEYVVTKNNNYVSGETLMSAIENVYEKAYGYSEEGLASKMQEIIECNKERQRKCFPIRYKVLVDGTKIPIENEVNKFDINPNKISRSI